MNPRSTLALAILSTLPTLAQAAPGKTIEHHNKELATVVVSADPLGQQNSDAAQPVKVLAGAELEDRRAATLGETVANEVGVQSSHFGPGVGRPIIRGLEGARVQMLTGGIATQDASTVSADHAVAIEPFLADQIEILKGPATLLYGSGAIGGIVNVIDGRIAEQGVDGMTGRAELRGDTGADERAGMVRLDGGTDRFVLHVDAHDRSTNDVETPGLVDSETLENSSTDTRGGAFGTTFLGEQGYFGVAFSRLDNRYGIPGHEHQEDESDVHDEEAVRIDLEQNRVDAKASWVAPIDVLERLNLELAHTDYTHAELEGDEVGTRFDVDAHDIRLEAVHTSVHDWRGIAGLSHSTRDFVAEGDEAFVPPSETTDTGVFFVERRKFDRFELELGARLDRTAINTDIGDRDFDSASFSFGGHWDIGETFHLKAGFDRAERAPTTEELFSDGAHVATSSYEIGNNTLDTEVAQQAELGFTWTLARATIEGAIYHNRFDRFIYLADSGEITDELPTRFWTQADARFSGYELETRLNLSDSASGRYDLRLMTDAVDAELASGASLPRIAPSRYGANLYWTLGNWRADLGAMRYQRQNDVAAFESPTPGFTTVNAGIAWTTVYGTSEWEVFARMKNLTNQVARVHTSFLKDDVPLAGRTLQAGIRWYF